MEQQNILIPKCKKLNAEEIKSLLEKFSLNSVFKLPKILIKDKGISEMDLVKGDVIEITRNSKIYDNSQYWRVVTE